MLTLNSEEGGLRGFLLGLAVLCCTSGAYAQEQATPTTGPLFAMRDGSVVVNVGGVERGQVFAAVPVRFRQVARLRAEVHENSPLVLGYHGLPAGAPLFAATFVGSGSSRFDGARWCGVAVEGGTLCAFGSAERSWIFMAGDAYAPHRIVHDPYPASGLDVVADPTAEADIPPLELVYGFHRWRRREAEVRVSVRALGQLSFLEMRRLPRLADGSATLRVADGILRLIETGDSSATIAIMERPRGAGESAPTGVTSSKPMH